MDQFTFILLPLYILLVLGLALLYDGSARLRGREKQFFWLGLVFKLFCTLGFVFVYQVVFQGGDTFGYYKNGTVFYNVLLQDPLEAARLFFWQKGDVVFSLQDIVPQMRLYGATSTGTIVQLAGMIGLFTFNNFYCTSVLFGAFSFAGMWAFYRAFADLFPEIKTKLFIAALLIPSVGFWSAGILKDSVTLGFMGFLFYGFYYLVIKKERRFLAALLFIVSFYFIWRIKFYIAICLLPAMMFWAFMHHLNFLRERTFKVLVLFSTFSLTLILGFVFSNQLVRVLNKGLSVFIDKSIDFQGWHGLLGQNGHGSGYSLGDIEFTIPGILSKFPISVFTCYFRPFLHESNNIVSGISAVENFGLLLFTLFVVFKTGIFRTIKLVFTKHIIFSLLIFVLLFGFITGFTSYNFGALVRYRIPCVPVFVIMLFLIRYYDTHREENLEEAVVSTAV